MIASLYNELIQFEEIGGDMVSRIKSLEVFHVFEPLVKFEAADGLPCEMEVFNSILFWILHCYSKESRKDILGADWSTIKNNVAVSVKMPNAIISRVLSMEDYNVRKTVTNYLEYQDYRTYKHVNVLKEQYDQMLSASLKSLMKGEDVDYVMKYKCGEFADALLIRINNYEQKLKDDNRDQKEAITEVEAKSKRRIGSSLSVDSNENIKS